mgnify:CR=1 FL=1
MYQAVIILLTLTLNNTLYVIIVDYNPNYIGVKCSLIVYDLI